MTSAFLSSEGEIIIASLIPAKNVGKNTGEKNTIKKKKNAEEILRKGGCTLSVFNDSVPFSSSHYITHYNYNSTNGKYTSFFKKISQNNSRAKNLGSFYRKKTPDRKLRVPILQTIHSHVKGLGGPETGSGSGAGAG
jgi:hypothetical protein